MLPDMYFPEVYTLMFMWQAFPPAKVIFTGVGVLLSVSILNNFTWAIITSTFLRQSRTFGLAKIHLSTFLSVSNWFSDDWRFTPKCSRPRK